MSGLVLLVATLNCWISYKNTCRTVGSSLAVCLEPMAHCRIVASLFYRYYWFKSYLSDRKQFVFITGYNSDLMPVDCGVPQGFVLGLLLFFIYINDLHKAIHYCKVHHFTDDTNLFLTSKSVKNLNKQINCDMKHLNN